MLQPKKEMNALLIHLRAAKQKSVSVVVPTTKKGKDKSKMHSKDEAKAFAAKKKKDNAAKAAKKKQAWLDRQ